MRSYLSTDWSLSFGAWGPTFFPKPGKGPQSIATLEGGGGGASSWCELEGGGGSGKQALKTRPDLFPLTSVQGRFWWFA